MLTTVSLQNFLQGPRGRKAAVPSWELICDSRYLYHCCLKYWSWNTRTIFKWLSTLKFLKMTLINSIRNNYRQNKGKKTELKSWLRKINKAFSFFFNVNVLTTSTGCALSTYKDQKRVLDLSELWLHMAVIQLCGNQTQVLCKNNTYPLNCWAIFPAHILFLNNKKIRNLKYLNIHFLFFSMSDQSQSHEINFKVACNCSAIKGIYGWTNHY